MEKQVVTRYAVIPAVLSAFCVMFHYGFIVGTFNSLTPLMKDFYNDSYTVQFGSALSGETSDFLLALTAAVFPLGGICGSFLVKPLVQKLGRRKTLLYNQIIILFSIILMASSKILNLFESIIVGRLLAGVFAAIGMGVAPIYVTEISAHQVRGPIGGIFSTSIALGNLIGNTLGLKELFGTEGKWPFVYVFGILPIITQLAYAPWMPKSPRALYIDKNRPEYAKEVLFRLRGGNDVGRELDDLRRESICSTRFKTMTACEVIKAKHLRWQLISCLVIMSTLQLSGINGIQFYLNDIFLAAGISSDNVVYCSIAVVTIQVFIALGGGFLAERFGRKVLLVIGNAILTVSYVIFTVALGFPTTKLTSYTCIFAVIVAIIGQSIGPGAVTYSVAPELFDQVSRPAAMTMGTLVLWISFALVAFAAPYLFEFLDFAAFMPFFAITLSTTIFIYIVVPETKGLSFIRVNALFAARNKIPADNSKFSDAVKPTSGIPVLISTCIDKDNNNFIESSSTSI